MKIKLKISNCYFNNDNNMLPETAETRSILTAASKGSSIRRSGADECGKGERMDSSRTRQCASILKNLMNHPTGWVFNQPVDPVKLNIPDYFSIISRPMDLGTIKKKLSSKQYSSTDQFAADIRLTFSNAMRYNPPGNEVHFMAKELNSFFNSKWKLLEVRWKKGSSVSSPQSVSNVEKQSQVIQKRPSDFSNSLRPLPSSEKLKLIKELSSMSWRNMPPRLLSFLQKKHQLGQTEDFIGVDIDMLDEESLWELHRIVNSCLEARPTEMENCSKRPEQHRWKGGSGLSAGGSSKKSFIKPIKDAHEDIDCQSFQCHDINTTSSSDVDSERSLGREHSLYHSSADAQDSLSTLKSMDYCNAALETKGEVDLPCLEQLSPTKALRAAMLKSRFADTILKAKQQSLGEKLDPEKLQQEREKLEKMQQEEKVRIEAQVKAAEAAARVKAEAEAKMQREKEREAARMALLEMEKNNHNLLNDLENIGCPPPGHYDMPDDELARFMDEFELRPGMRNPLEKLGLFMKEEDLDEEVDGWVSAAGNGDTEEGEIDDSY